MKIIFISMLLYLCTGTKRKSTVVEETTNYRQKVCNCDESNSNATFNSFYSDKSSKFGNFLDDYEEVLTEIDNESELQNLTYEEIDKYLLEVESGCHQSVKNNDQKNESKQICGIVDEKSSVVHPLSLETQANRIPRNILNDNQGQIQNVSIKYATNVIFVKEIENLTCMKADEAFNKNCLEVNVNKVMSSIVSSLKAYIDKYIISNMHESYRKPHIRRLNLIKESFLAFENHKLDENDLNLIYDILKNEELIHKFDVFISQFKEGLEFNREFCKTFFLKYDSDIFYSKHSYKIRKKLDSLSNFQKRLFFYYELMNLYKYVYDIPEILTLGCLFSDNSFYKICNVMQMINLIVHKIEDIKTRRNFVLCMIHVAFDYYHGRLFNIFLIPNYRFVCNKELHDLNFFIWEFNCYRRREMKLRRHLTEKCIAYDKKYFKLILFIYLYQHSIFIKFFKVKGEPLIVFLKFVNKVIISNQCIACLLKEYLIIVQQSIKD